MQVVWRGRISVGIGMMSGNWAVAWACEREVISWAAALEGGEVGAGVLRQVVFRKILCAKDVGWGGECARWAVAAMLVA